jgi:hypothetical protein
VERLPDQRVIIDNKSFHADVTSGRAGAQIGKYTLFASLTRSWWLELKAVRIGEPRS